MRKISNNWGDKWFIVDVENRKHYVLQQDESQVNTYSVYDNGTPPPETIVFLKPKDDPKQQLPIWIGESEAKGITLGMKAAKTPRPPTYPSRDGFIFMLKQAEEGVAIAPNRNQSGYWDAYVWVNNVDTLFAEFKKNRAIIDYEPCIQEEYDMKEFAVKDLDGYVIVFGQHHES